MNILLIKRFVIAVFLSTISSYSLASEPANTFSQEPTNDSALEHTVTADNIELLSKSLDKMKAQISAISASKDSESLELVSSIASLKTQIDNVEKNLEKLKSSGHIDIEKRVDNLYDEKKYFSYADFAAIAITCVSVLITVVGIAIALLSFFGFKNILKTTRSSTTALATQIANDTAKNAIEPAVEKQLTKLIDEGKINKHLEEVVDNFILRRGPSQERNSIDNNIDWEELDWEEPSDAESEDNSPQQAKKNNS
ncbi:hypothetical protein BOO21_19020 [Vibrio cidicii]|nr:hypothetical protein [Vibrio cidicii]